MAKAATKIPESLDVVIDCGAPGCVSGTITHTETRISKSSIRHHMESHAYTKRHGGFLEPPIGADCDCPRTVTKVKSTCQACRGTGVKTVHLSVPQAGQRVNVQDEELMINIFGDDVPNYPGVVFDVQLPDEHGLELRTGLGVRVSWDLLKNGKTIRAGDVQVWTFDLLEVEVV